MVVRLERDSTRRSARKSEDEASSQITHLWGRYVGYGEKPGEGPI
jgi:hypothetical protein